MAPTSHKGLSGVQAPQMLNLLALRCSASSRTGVSRASAGSIGGTNIIALTVTRPGSSISAVVDFAYKWADDSS